MAILKRPFDIEIIPCSQTACTANKKQYFLNKIFFYHTLKNITIIVIIINLTREINSRTNVLKLHYLRLLAFLEAIMNFLVETLCLFGHSGGKIRSMVIVTTNENKQKRLLH